MRSVETVSVRRFTLDHARRVSDRVIANPERPGEGFLSSRERAARVGETLAVTLLLPTQVLMVAQHRSTLAAVAAIALATAGVHVRAGTPMFTLPGMTGNCSLARIQVSTP